MLKIKDNVDLKKLKKFGFIEYMSLDDGKMYFCICNIFVGEDRYIKQDDGINECMDCEHKFSDTELDFLYNLIQAGLVEKV